MSVLGRDILELFVLIADLNRDSLGLLRGRHGYEIITGR